MHDTRANGFSQGDVSRGTSLAQKQFFVLQFNDINVDASQRSRGMKIIGQNYTNTI